MKTKIHILHIDDNIHDRQLVIDALQRENNEFNVTEADNREKFEKYLAEGTFDLVLSDFNILGFDGLQVLQFVKSQNPGLPVIIVTGTGSEEIAIQAMKMGASDYVIKSVNHIRGLVPTIKKVLEHKKVQEEQKRAEDALHESEIRLRRLLENSLDGILMTSPDGRIFSANPAMCTLLNRTEEEIIHLGRQGIVDTNDPHLPILIEEREKTGKAKGELRMIRKDGLMVPVEVSTSLFVDKFGEVRTSMIVRDITTRKQVEKALRYSEELFRSLFENATIGLYRTAPDGAILMANPTLIRMLGYTTFEELAQRNLEEEGFEPDFSRKSYLKKLEKEGEIHGFESAWKRKDGSFVFVRESSRVNRDIDGNIMYYEGTVEDITDRKRVEEELRFANILLSKQQEVSIDGILVVNENNKIISYNHRFVEMMGIPAELLESKTDAPVLQFVTKQMANPEQFVQRVEYLYEHKQDTSFEELGLKNGDTLERYSAPIFGSSDQYYGRVWYFHDITERKRNEEALIRAKEKAEESDHLKSAFLANISHEIRTPMNAIVGFANLLKNKKLAAEKQESFIEVINSSSRQLLAIIGDIVEISKIETNQVKINKTSVDINKLVETVFNHYLLAVQEKEKYFHWFSTKIFLQKNCW